MALSILDGNQSATTLSTIVTGGQHIPAHTVVSLGSQAITDMRSAVSGSVVSISNFPSTQPISGTVTVGASSVTFNSNVAKRDDGSWTNLGVETGSGYVKARVYPSDVAPFTATVTVGNSVTIGSLPYTTTITGVGSHFGQGGGLAGSVVTAVPVILSSNGNIGGSLMSYDGSNTSLNVNIKGTVPAISGTVTVGAMPSGALTTRFGSVTTANTAQLTSAVTNTSRKYLLVQNIATSTVTIGIGFAPTTTQGIQLTAGAGLTFDAFCPTGGVWWLSSTTGSNFSILEG